MEPASFECVSCYGRGCDTCNQTGRFELTSCSVPLITADVWRMLKWVLRAEKHGLLPCAGGGLAQTVSFLDSWDFMSRELRFWEAKGG